MYVFIYFIYIWEHDTNGVFSNKPLFDYQMVLRRVGQFRCGILVICGYPGFPISGSLQMRLVMVIKWRVAKNN